MAVRECVKVVKAGPLAEGIFEMVIESPKMVELAKPGQFVSLYSNDAAHLLPRPISICEVLEDGIRFVYRAVGAGTTEFSKMKAGDTLVAQGPLGNGYEAVLNAGSKAILVGGGIGVPPMLELSKQLTVPHTVVCGYRNADTFLVDDFKKYSDFVIATDDGSLGTHGTVIDAIKEQGVTGDVIYACGPMPMLKAVKAYAAEQGMKAYISLEERMACGIGACLGCVTKTVHKDEHSKVNNARVCVEGPVFDAEEVEI